LRRIAVSLLALVSIGLAALWFIRETTPRSIAQLDAARPSLTEADQRALATPINYRDAVPVISFHDVSMREGYSTVSPARFATLLAALRRAGFHSVSLAQVSEVVAGRRPSLPQRPLLITFDDTVATEYTTVDPILKANDFRAVSFVSPAQVSDGRQPSYYLSWPQLRSMVSTGRWEFQLHADGTADDVTSAVAADFAPAAARLRAVTEDDVYALSYPFSEAALPASKPGVVSRVRRLAGRSFELGFLDDEHAPVAVDSHSDPLLLPRFGVSDQTDVATLFDGLRRMVPSAPTQGIAGWNVNGKHCALADDKLTIQAVGYAVCRGDINGDRWTDYRIQAAVSGLVNRTTLIMICRANRDGDLELSIGSRRAVLRQLLHGRYTTLGDWPTEPPGDGGSHTVTSDVVGRRATVTVDGVELGTAEVDSALGYGGPGFGIAGGGVITLTAGATDLSVG
jgi:peptidoglycan/xylan/chitin deacetylase (PgdA/CDA1 family)